MPREWDLAPDFTVPMARPENADGRGSYTPADVESFTLSDRLVYGPVVLAFFPGVYSGICTDELVAIADWLGDRGGLDATVAGVSADTPWSQLAFLDEHDVPFPLLSGFNTDVIAEYGVRLEDGPLAGIATRSVFVIDEEQSVVYRWVAEEPGVLPDLDEVADAVATARS